MQGASPVTYKKAASPLLSELFAPSSEGDSPHTWANEMPNQHVSVQAQETASQGKHFILLYTAILKKNLDRYWFSGIIKCAVSALQALNHLYL